MAVVWLARLQSCFGDGGKRPTGPSSTGDGWRDAKLLTPSLDTAVMQEDLYVQILVHAIFDT
jgi:hypothetical protein